MNPTVLIVDDSATVRMHLVQEFRAAGFDAMPCASLAAARAAVAERSFDVMVLDVLLPDGDGIEYVQELRGSPATRAIPVMLLSTEAEVRDRVRGLTMGASEYIGKPYDAAQVIARALQLARRHDPPAPTDPRTSVLVIDDSPTFLAAITATLRAADYVVLTATTGEEGLFLAAAQRPALVIVDRQLPGIDGATVIRRIRLDAAIRQTPCLLLTAAEDRESELQALDAGADAFVRKDEDNAVVLARLTAILRGVHRLTEEPGPESLMGPKRILAVDDSPTYLQVLTAALRAEGYDVVSARSGEEALDLLAVQQVDGILLDLRMPGMGGCETCRQIKAAPGLRDVPLIMLTAVEERSAMIEGLAAGADDYIAKSSDIDVLRARLRAQLRRRQFEDENRRFRERVLQMEAEIHEAHAARERAAERAQMVEELERQNRELETFSYTVSHDLRAPLRVIDGFSQSLLEEYAPGWDTEARQYLQYVREATHRMGELIDDLLELARVGRIALRRERMDLSALAAAVASQLQRSTPERPEHTVRFAIDGGITLDADPSLMRAVLENLIGNALKFTHGTPEAVIELRVEGAEGFLVRDNGAGFDMAYANKLFKPFQRLHTAAEFPGTGVGLATVQRIVERHGGRVWAEGAVGRGAVIHVSLPGAEGALGVAPWRALSLEPVPVLPTVSPAAKGIG